MSKREPLIIVVVLVVVLAAAFFAYSVLSNTAASTSSTAVSASAPAGSAAYEKLADYNPTVYTATGEPTTFTDIAQGKPLVVNFWATWCPYCIEEMPDFQKIYDDYRDRVSFAFVDCADGQRETVQAAVAWLEQQGLSLPAYYDTKLQAMRMYNATGLPTTAVADAQGNIISVAAGRIDPSRVRATLDQLVAGS